MRVARHLAVVLALALVASVAACGGASSPSPLASVEPSVESSAVASPSGFSFPAPSSPSAPPLASPSASPSADPSLGSPDVESQAPGAADACTGTDENREFFLSVAAAVPWTVYCPVLPAGWLVDSGEYRGAAGGRMAIAYERSGGLRLELSEGAFCADADGCVPPGPDVGAATFGDMDGSLVALDDGGWAIVVDRGKDVSWLAIVSGVDEAGARALGAALIPVDG